MAGSETETKARANGRSRGQETASVFEAVTAVRTAQTRPLVTLYVAAFNQERFVRSAVEGALAQTYQPLEIVLSDDASADGTFAVMQEVAAHYHGPHRIVLNRNPANLGIPRHVDRIMQLSRGGFVVQNAGDDISLPHRVERMVAIWRAEGSQVMAIHSAKDRIDVEGRGLGPGVDPNPIDGHDPLGLLTERPGINGASMGWDRRVFETFGPLGDVPVFEDYPISLRAALLGRVVYLDEPLVQYRVGGLSSPAREPLGHCMLYGHRLRSLAWHLSFNRQFLKDLERLPGLDTAACRAQCLSNIRNLSCEIDLAGMSHAERFAALPGALWSSLRRRDGAQLRKTVKYAFDGPYMSWLTLRGGTVGGKQA